MVLFAGAPLKGSGLSGNLVIGAIKIPTQLRWQHQQLNWAINSWASVLFFGSERAKSLVAISSGMRCCTASHVMPRHFGRALGPCTWFVGTAQPCCHGVQPLLGPALVWVLWEVVIDIGEGQCSRPSRPISNHELPTDGTWVRFRQPHTRTLKCAESVTHERN